MGAFDDLIPKPAGSTGLFDDLIPDLGAPELPVAPVAPSPLSDVLMGAPAAPAPPALALPVDPGPMTAPMAQPAPISAVFEDLVPEQDPLIAVLENQLLTMPETMHPQIKARIAELSAPKVEAPKVVVPEEQDPFDGEGASALLKRRGQQFMQGLTEIPASVPESLAVAGAGNPNAAAQVSSEIVQRAQEQIALADERLANLPNMSDEQRQRIEAVKAEAEQQISAYQELLDITDGPLKPDAADRPLFKAGQKIRDASTEAFGAPDQRDDSLWGKVATGAGTMTGFVATTLLTGLPGGAAMGASVNTSQVYREARQMGASEDEAKQASGWAAILGSGEALPITRALNVLPKRLRGEVSNKLAKRIVSVLKSGGEEAAQEAVQAMGNNLIAQGIYDPERGVLDDVGEQALIGGILGKTVGAGGQVADALIERSREKQKGTADVSDERSGRAGDTDPVRPGDELGSEPGATDLGERGAGDSRRSAPADPVEDIPGPDSSREPAGDLNGEEPAQPEPAPVVAEDAESPRPERRATVYTPENDPVEVEYQVVEADSVLTSDQQGFDQSAQPRNRKDNKNSEIQIEGIANAPNFGRLYRAPETDRGAPIVGADGLVESGNGRTIGLRRAYERGTANEYRAALEAEFPEAAGMQNPIVVARRITDVDREDFAYRSNKPATQAMSAVEEAQAEARLVDKDVLDLYRGGPITAAGNRDMVMALIKKLPASDQNRMVNPEGGLSVDGMRRVQNAVFSRAYGDPELLTRMAESVDDDMKGMTGVLTDLAPRVARMRDAMDRGEVASEGDFTPALIEAIKQVSNIRSRGENLSDFKAQTDAFADPLSEDVQIIMDALFNEAGTRLASKKAVSDFIEFAIEEAEAQDTTTDTLPGVEPVPPKPSTEIVRNAKRKTETDDEQTALFDRAESPRKRPDKGRKKAQRTSDGAGREEDAGSVQDAAARVGRRPPGRLSPTFLEHSYTNRPSVFDHAFKAAGVDPAEARLMGMDKQIGIVRKAIEQTFGVKVELPKIKVRRKNLAGRKVTDEKTSLSSRKALDQMLNAYRQLQMLAHVMGMPEKAVGLPIDGQPLTLSLVKGKHLRGALGMFSWGNGKRTISLADMSNSFAHEWGHALDHYLSAQSQKPFLKGMLSRAMAKDGVMQPLSPRRALTEAYAHVMWSMYGDSSAAGQITLQLQVESAQLGPDGKPTPKAKRAQKILTDIREGRTPPQEYWSTYFKTAAEFDRQVQGGGYFTDPAEMFARAFEAMIGHQVAAISDQPQAFLSKGEWAYSDKTDPRAALTFPKDVDLAQFTLAMRNLQHAMARIKLHGPDAPADAPETHDIMSTRALLKDPQQGAWTTLTQRERAEWARTLDIMAHAPSEMKKKAVSVKQGMANFYSHALRTTAATMYATADRQENPAAKAAFTNIAKKVGKRPGNGQLVENIWEEKVRRKAAVYVNKIDGAMKKAAAAKRRFRLSKEQNRQLRALLVDDKVETTPEIRKLASDLRAIMNDIWYDLDSAGIELGYASNYLPHRYDPQAASENPDKFRTQAAKVYDLMFQREIVDNDDAESQLADMKAIFNGLQRAMQAMPDGDAVPAPRLSDSQQETVQEYFEAVRELKKAKKSHADVKTDKAKARHQDRIDEIEAGIGDLQAAALDVLGSEWSKYSAEKWLTKIRTGNLDDYGSIGPTASFLKGRILPKEAGSYMAEFMEENPVEMITSYAMDAMRRSEYAQVFGAQNEKLENMLMAAEGATREDVELMKQAVAAATGRVNRALTGFQSMKSTTFSLGTMSMLSLATMSSLAEPLTAGIRSTQVRDSFRAMAEFFLNIPPSKRKRDLKELSRTIGLVMPYATDTLMENRMGMDVLDNKHWLQGTVSRFFILNGLTPLTHFQRTAMLPVANAVILRHLRAYVEGKRGIYGRARDVVDGKAKGFSDGELNELGIAEGDRKDLLEWLDSVGGMPSPEDLFGPDGDFHKAAEIWARATYRFSTETIQDTLKSDRTISANDPNYAAMYGIMSFIDAFTRNVIFRTLERGMKEGDGVATKGAKLTANVALAAAPVGLLVMGQIMTGALREAVFNRDELEERLEDGTALEWLIWRGVDRSGLTGRLQPFVNMVTGVRYETDMTSLFAGPYLVYFLGNIQKMIAAEVGRNSKNTNTSEFRAAEAIYKTMVKVPLTALVSGVAPGGPVSSNAARALIGYLAMGTTEDDFAEALVGEKGSKHVGDPPWWERGK